MTRLPWIEKYIVALRRTGLEASARGIAGVSKREVDDQVAIDPEFADAVDDALAKWSDRLEAEAYRRGVTGIERGVYYQGDLVATEKQYSDALLTTLLKAKRPDQFGDKKQITGAGGAPLTVHIRTFSTPLPDAPLPADADLTITGEFQRITSQLEDVLLDEITADDLA